MPEFTTWSEFSDCDTDCGSGMQTRARSCVCMGSGQPTTGCVGDEMESQSCRDFSDCSKIFVDSHHKSVFCGIFFEIDKF